jgi:hypothetical protein
VLVNPFWLGFGGSHFEVVNKMQNNIGSSLDRRWIYLMISLVALTFVITGWAASTLRSQAASRDLLNVREQTVAKSDETVGTPWTGSVAIHRTTAELMAADAAHPVERNSVSEQIRLAPPDRSSLTEDPRSPMSATFPVGAPATRTSAVQSPQTPGLSFDGATLSDTLMFPGDPNGAVGPTQYIVTVNGKLRSFNKTTGAADGVLNLVIDNFFVSVRNGAFLSGPRIRYDRLSQRWFILDCNTQTPNRVVLAVSDSANITAGTVWSFYFFQHDLVSPAGNTGQTIDHATLGIDANALYVGVLDYNVATFTNCTAFVIRKSSVLSGGPIVVSAFRDLIGTDGPYVPQGADNFDAVTGTGYFIGVARNSFGKLILRRVTNPGGTPTMSSNIEITVPATALPVNVQHLGNGFGVDGYLDGLDDRLQMAQIRGTHLWTVHNVGVDNTGVSAPGTATRTGSRWYELQNLDTTPALDQSGTLFTPSAANSADQASYWMASLMVSGQGHMAMGASTAGANDRINAATTGRLSNDPLGTLNAPVLLTSSSTGYNPNEGIPPGPRRWGRYSYTSVDPDDDMTMWTLQTYCQATDQYAVRVVQLKAPPPPAVLTASPPTVAPGSASVNVTITGASSGGSAFFDPGTGFAHRLTASVSGGVTVNSVTYLGPNQVTLNLNTTAAVIGKSDVTITNPDGQTTTNLGVLHINNGFSRTAHVDDFDGDAKSDVGVFRPSTGAWYIAKTNEGFYGQFWGTTGDLPVPADYDGDGCADIAVFRPSSGAWYIFQSSSHTLTSAAFGLDGDVPTPTDYDGDGKADIAVFRPSAGVWYLLQTTAGFGAVSFGQAGDVPVPGFYDTDNKADISIFRPSTGFWYRLNSASGNSFTFVPFGQNGDKPVVGDYDGDGRSDLAVFRPSDNTWYAQSIATNIPIFSRPFGATGDIAAPGDYDGDGKTDTAIFRPSTGGWFVFRSATNTVTGVGFGSPGDVPIESAYVP